jgi:hypothetical protein
LTEYQPHDKWRDIKLTSQYLNGTPAVQTIPVSVQVSIPPVLSAQSELHASSGIVDAYGLAYTLTNKNGSWPGTLTRTFFTTLAAAVAAAPSPDLRFTGVSQAYGYSSAASSFNPNFLGHANVNMLHVPEHVTSSATGAFVKDVQIQPHALGYWVLEVLRVTLS